MSLDGEKSCIKGLHNVSSVHDNYKLHVFAWLVIYQGLPTKAPPVRSGLLDGIFALCLKLGPMKHFFLDFPFVRCCWKIVHSEVSSFFHGKLHWGTTLLGHSNSLVCHSI